MINKFSNLKPIVLLLFLGGVAGSIVSLTDLYDRIFPGSENIHQFVGKSVCSDLACSSQNASLFRILSQNVGQTIDVDFEYSFSGAGNDYVKCANAYHNRDPSDGSAPLFIFLGTDASDCDEGFYFSSSALNVESAMAYLRYRVKGQFVIVHQSNGGTPLLTLKDF